MNKRIEALRERALKADYSLDEIKYRFFKAHGTGEITYDSYAEAYGKAFDKISVNIDPCELIVGRYADGLSAEERAEWETVYFPYTEQLYEKTNKGQNSHMAVDYPLLLDKGLCGVKEIVCGYMKDCDEDKLPFYRACVACLDAVARLSDRYADEAERMARSLEGEQKEELLTVAEVCRRVPRYPARTFREAVQSVHFITYALSLDPLRKWHQQFQLGHPDRYLISYYEADIADGRIDKERAQLLLDLLGIQINMRVPSGLSSGYMVGGIDRGGRVVANELTYMLMQVIDDIRLVYPSVGLCYTEEMGDGYLRKACEILSHGRSHPAIFNDKVISAGIRSYGVPEDQSRDYIHSTCVEITPCASSNVWVASPYTNMAQLLLDILEQDYDSFEELFSALLARLDGIIEKNYYYEEELRALRAESSVLPLLSCFVDDCLAKGVDIERGGARYNWVLPSFVGMANLVDSLYAIKSAVYDEKTLSLSALREMIKCNFEGNEAVRLHLLNDIPKYGNDIDDIDRYFGMLTDHIAAECRKYMGAYSNGNYIPSVFCWVMHERFGRATGATPDGRVSGFPLGDGSGPCQGREHKGPTASILSSTKWDHSPLIGGVAVNMKFSRSNLGEHSLDVMTGLVKTYIERGGFEMQINVTDRAILEEARKDPEQYADLVVRIGGYSDYFTRLSPEMQSEVILRTEHTI